MANDELKEFIEKNVEFKWPKLDQPYRFNNATKKSEPCAATVTGAGYSVAFEMPEARARELHGKLKAHYLAVKAAGKKLPDFGKVFGMKKDAETGTVTFTAKKNAVKGNGDLAKPPAVVGRKLEPLEDRAIWSGSKGSVQFLAIPITDPDGVGGISLHLMSVQVTDAVYGGTDLASVYDAMDDDAADLGSLPSEAPRPAKSAVPADAEW